MKKISLAFLLVLMMAGNARADITTNLELWWKFDDNTGTTTADSSGNGRTGTFSNTPAWVAGQVNTGLDFEEGDSDGVENAVSVPFTAIPATICAWVKPETLVTTRFIISVYDSGAESRFYLAHDSTGAVLAGLRDNGGTSENATSTAVMTAGVWYHICGTFASGAGNLKVYIDGATPQTNTISVTPSGVDTVAAGHQNLVGYFDGVIDEVRIYSRELSAADVIELRDYGNPSVQRLVTSSSDDAQELATTMTLNGTTIGGDLDNSNEWIGMRFNNIAIANGATIVSAVVAVVPTSSTQDEPLVTVYLEAADDCATFGAGASNISSRSRTTGVSWSNTNLGADGATYFDTPSLVSDVQAVVNRAGWASGNDMCVLINSQGTGTRDLTVEAYDLGPGTNPPRLTITWTAAATRRNFSLLGVGP